VVLLAVESVLDSEGKEVEETMLLLDKVMEGAGDLQLITEVDPDAEDLAAAPDSLRGDCSIGVLQSKAESSSEEVSLGRCNSFHGRVCG
jgi:hypothetical protein